MDKSNKFHKNCKTAYVILVIILIIIELSLIVSLATLPIPIGGMNLLILNLFGFLIALCFLWMKRHDAAILSNNLAEGVVEKILSKPVNDENDCMENNKTKNDISSPILYCRPFIADGRQLHFAGNNFKSEEEHIDYIFKGVGPFLAIGNAMETAPPLGALRTYVPNEEWQNHVIELVKRARLVIIKIGISDAVLWEFKVAVKLLKPEQIILLTGKSRKQYETFCEAANKYTKMPLPEYIRVKWRLSGSIGGLVYFKKDWTPVYQPIRYEPLRKVNHEFPLVPGLMMGFQPVFEQLNIPWKEPEKASIPPVLIAGIIIVIMMLLIIFLVALA